MKNCINYNKRIKRLKIALIVTKWCYRVFFPISLFYLTLGYIKGEFSFTPFTAVYVLFGVFLVYKDYVEWKLNKHGGPKEYCDLKEKENHTVDI